MSRIHVMPEILASQVAAGEVVERPASVVKELVENSLDAKSRRIEVLIRRGGISLIRVVDDGIGMDREDALKCLDRHATSKIRTSADLAGILTLGFRGEALPSIASVSKFSLRTREHDAVAGTAVLVEGGTVVSVEDSGEAPGTQVEVRNLFYNIPARRKFLRAESTEFSHIEQHLRTQALAHPEVSFSLSHDERLVFHVAGESGLLERIRDLCGQDLAERLLPVPKIQRGALTVSGFVGEPGFSRANRSFCFTFLNGRPVESVLFNQAFRAAYGEALGRGQHAVAFLFLEIDPTEVDVNVHPSKREVRFRDGIGVQASLTAILTEVLRSVRSSLRPAAPTVGSVGLPPSVRALDEGVAAGDLVSPGSSGIPSGSPKPPVARWQPPIRQTELPIHQEPEKLSLETNAATPPGDPPGPPAKETAPDPPAPRQATPNPYRILGVLNHEYVLMESSEGLVILDFRAAWERIFFEDARLKASRQTPISQRLLVPITLQLGPREFDFMKRHLGLLQNLGIGAEEFGAQTLKIDALPASLGHSEKTDALLHQLIDDLLHAQEKTALHRLDLDGIAAIVSSQAARLKIPGDLREIDEVVSQLLACEMPYCCPVGRATLVQLSHSELARKFGKR